MPTGTCWARMASSAPGASRWRYARLWADLSGCSLVLRAFRAEPCASHLLHNTGHTGLEHMPAQLDPAFGGCLDVYASLAGAVKLAQRPATALEPCNLPNSAHVQDSTVTMGASKPLSALTHTRSLVLVQRQQSGAITIPASPPRPLGRFRHTLSETSLAASVPGSMSNLSELDG